MSLRAVPQRMGRLARRLDTSLPSTTSIVSRLEQRGLVERVPDETDRRGVLCRLTLPGRQEIDSLYEHQRAIMIARLDRLDLGELGTVAHAFTLIARAMVPAV
jgi:DNA-binding MarR family transcriptional regulator